jgi:hypothetical protein
MDLENDKRCPDHFCGLLFCPLGTASFLVSSYTFSNLVRTTAIDNNHAAKKRSPQNVAGVV